MCTKNIFWFLFILLANNSAFGQPQIPSGPIKIRDLDATGVLFIDAATSANGGQIQLINQYSDNPTALWKLIPLGADLFHIQNVRTGEYLGINTDTVLNSYAGQLYFAYVSKNSVGNGFRWKVKFYMQRKPGMQTSLLDNARQTTNKSPYENKYRADDAYDFINVQTGSRLTTLSINGILAGDLVRRLAVEVTDADEYTTVQAGKDANGKTIYKKSDAPVGRNNQSRFQFFSGTKNSKEQNSTASSRPGSDRVNNNETTSTTENPTASANSNARPAAKPASNQLIGNWALKSIDRFTITNNKERKIPNIFGNAGNYNLQFHFINDSELKVSNKKETLAYTYTWDGSGHLTIKPASVKTKLEEFGENYTGTVSFSNKQMLFTVISHPAKNRTLKEIYIYEKN